MRRLAFMWRVSDSSAVKSSRSTGKLANQVTVWVVPQLSSQKPLILYCGQQKPSTKWLKCVCGVQHSYWLTGQWHTGNLAPMCVCAWMCRETVRYYIVVRTVRSTVQNRENGMCTPSKRHGTKRLFFLFFFCDRYCIYKCIGTYIHTTTLLSHTRSCNYFVMIGLPCDHLNLPIKTLFANKHIYN